MDKLRNLYMYLVCFVTLMMIIWGSIAVVRSAMDVIFPEDYSYYETIKSPDAEDAESEEVIAERKARDKKNETSRNTKQLAYSIVIVVVAIPVYKYHWNKVDKVKQAV